MWVWKYQLCPVANPANSILQCAQRALCAVSAESCIWQRQSKDIRSKYMFIRRLTCRLWPNQTWFLHKTCFLGLLHAGSLIEPLQVLAPASGTIPWLFPHTLTIPYSNPYTCEKWAQERCRAKQQVFWRFAFGSLHETSTQTDPSFDQMISSTTSGNRMF